MYMLPGNIFIIHQFENREKEGVYIYIDRNVKRMRLLDNFVDKTKLGSLKVHKLQKINSKVW